MRRDNKKKKKEKKEKEENKQKCITTGTRRDWNKRIDLTDWCADGISSAREPPHQPLNRIKRNCNVAVIIRSRSRYCRERAVDAARFIAPIDFVVSLAVVNKNASLISYLDAASRVIKARIARYFHSLPRYKIDE